MEELMFISFLRIITLFIIFDLIMQKETVMNKLFLKNNTLPLKTRDMCYW